MASSSWQSPEGRHASGISFGFIGANRLSFLSSSGALRGFGCGLLFRIFEAVNIREVAPELAHHFEHFGDWLRAIEYLMFAADSAGRRLGQAAGILEHALELVSNLPEVNRAAQETSILEIFATHHCARVMLSRASCLLCLESSRRYIQLII